MKYFGFIDVFSTVACMKERDWVVYKQGLLVQEFKTWRDLSSSKQGLLLSSGHLETAVMKERDFCSCKQGLLAQESLGFDGAISTEISIIPSVAKVI